jgi:predicted RND superfamily exporter protein
MSVRFARFIERFAAAIIVVTLAITAASIVLASRLRISTDLAALLPRGYPSVEDYHRLMRRVGGSASLTIVVESPDFEANRRFADTLVPELQKQMGGEIANIDYRVDALQSFFKKHAILYLSLDDLHNLEGRLKDAVRDAKLSLSPLPYDLGLDDEKTVDPEKKAKDMRAFIEKKRPPVLRFKQGYYSGEDGHLLAIFVRPRSSGSDADVARAFLDKVRRVADSVQPKRFHPQLKVDFTGAYPITLDEQAAIKHDLVSTAGLCLALIAAALLFYFRRVRSMYLLGLTLVCGCAWSFALAFFTVGYLNVQTAFLGSIIAGTGINYGIILLARYFELRRGGQSIERALPVALTDAFTGTLTAAITTAISFATLMVAHISSFRHFAIIGGGGILFCWILSFTFLPALLVWSERLQPVVKRTRTPSPEWPEPFVNLPLDNPGLTVAAGLLAVVVGAFAFYHFAPHVYETDGRNLRNRSSIESGAAKLDSRVGTMRGESTTPAYIVTDSQDQSRRVCEVLNDEAQQHGLAAGPLKECRSLFYFVPDHQEEKLAIARRMLATLDSLPDDGLPASMESLIKELRDMKLDQVQLADLPDDLVRPFREVNGEVGRLVVVYPPDGRDLWIQENLYAFADAVRVVDLGGGERVTSSGETVIFADILREIGRDAPLTTALAFLGVVVCVAIALRNRGTWHVVGALTIGILWMLGTSSLMHVKLNFFNFVAIPTTFGICVDYAINVYTRARSLMKEHDKRRALELALRTTGGAVFLCSLTTIIGYATLIIADNMALVSFGKLAILGELTGITGALFLLPATMMLDARLRKPR